MTASEQKRRGWAVIEKRRSKENDPVWLGRERAEAMGLWYDPKQADRICRFFKAHLRHTKGRWAGEPFDPLNWQRVHVLEPLFGWRRESDGHRRYRRGSIWIPKKNGKTTMGAGVSHYMLTADGEEGAEVYSAAIDRNQASIIYREMSAMARKSEKLTELLKLIDSTKTISYMRKNSYYTALSSDAPSKEGLNAHCLFFDEIHALKNPELWTTLYYSTIARTQPLFLAISTAGVYMPESIGWREWDYANKVLRGTVSVEDDPQYFPFVRATSPDSDLDDPKSWEESNPSWGETISPEEFKLSHARARLNPIEWNDFKRYRLNIWISSVSKYLDVKKWNQGKVDFDADKLVGLPCKIGMDLSAEIDLTAVVILLGPDSDGNIYSLEHYFMPEDTIIARRTQDNVPYDVWVSSGWITATPGAMIDREHICNHVVEASSKYRPSEIGYDKFNALEVAQILEKHGETMVSIPQVASHLSAPTKRLQALINSGKWKHFGNPVTRWMVDNVVVAVDSNDNVRPHKGKSTQRIDGIAATVTALSRLMVGDDKTIQFTGFF